jgi:hypothetical protein
LIKVLLAYTGATALLFSVAVAFILWSGFQKAIKLDRGGLTFSAPPCFFPLEDARLERRVMSVKESQVLTVTLAAPSETECETTVRVQAPKFDLGDKAERKITVPPNLQKVRLVWVISPKDVGTYVIVVAVGHSDLRSLRLGVTVTNVLGLTARWAQIAMYLAGVLGPILTVPWWYEKLKQMKTRSNHNTIKDGHDVI